MRVKLSQIVESRNDHLENSNYFCALFATLGQPPGAANV